MIAQSRARACTRKGAGIANFFRARPNAGSMDAPRRMATKDAKDEPSQAAPAAGRAEGQPKVTWDDSKMKTSYANVCNVLGTREEVMLLFGANQAWQGGQKEVTVALSERIVLNPYAAKRLMHMLQQGLKEYEARYGELKI